MQKILAVSGGVDSMVLLDLFKDDPQAVVAHFNHGTRPSADADQLFVAATAQKYNLPFFTAKQTLGANVSEAKAREARYNFLYQVAKAQNGQIYTAHHLDDLIESVVINFIRGTSWRGLVPLGNSALSRPFIDKNFFRTDILRYAAQHQIVYRQDPTNTEPDYLRNRLRPLCSNLSQTQKIALTNLVSQQKNLATEITKILQILQPLDGIYQRAWFEELDLSVAIEFLRFALLKTKQLSLTRPQLMDFLTAIKTYQPGKKFNLPKNNFITIHQKFFQL